MCGYFCTGFIDFIIADKKLTDFTGMFSPRDFAKKMTVSFLVILKMNGINRTNLADQTKFRLKEISKIENYLNQEIDQRKLCCKKLCKYVTAFDYIDKILIVLSATSGGVCIFLSVSVVGAPIGIAGASLTLIFSLTTGITKKLLSIRRNKKKKYDKILILVKSKLNRIENLVSQAPIDMEISQEECITILKEKDKYEKMNIYVLNLKL